MVLDIDPMLLGTPALGLSLGHDWGISTGSRGYDVGPVYQNTQQVGLGDIRVYDDAFSLGRRAHRELELHARARAGNRGAPGRRPARPVRLRTPSVRSALRKRLAFISPRGHQGSGVPRFA